MFARQTQWRKKLDKAQNINILNSKLDYLEGHRLCIKNALEHIETSKLAIRQKFYGIANSHLILASEEGIKAAMLFSIHIEPKLENKIKNFNKNFKDHIHKHKVSN